MLFEEQLLLLQVRVDVIDQDLASLCGSPLVVAPLVRAAGRVWRCGSSGDEVDLRLWWLSRNLSGKKVRWMVWRRGDRR